MPQTNPTELNPVTGRDVSQVGFQGGQQFLGVFDITALPLDEIMRPGALKRLQKEHPEIGDTIRLDELRSLGIDPKDLTKDLRTELINADLLTKRGTLAPESQLQRFTAGVQPGELISGATTDAMNLVTGGVDLTQIGMSLAAGRIDDPLARDVLRNFNNQFGMAQASRGMGTSFGGGQASLQSVTGGLQALSSLGMNLIGAGQAGIQTGFQMDPFLNPAFALDRADLGYQQDVFDWLVRKGSSAAHRAAQSIQEAQRTNQGLTAASIIVPAVSGFIQNR